MSEESPNLGIPALRENPFKARPLEMGQSSLLIGRDEISARWARFLKSRNARMILLIGESGSGRSSLMRCVSEETSKSVHLDMFPTENHAYKILHEIFVSLIGFDVPSSTQELVARLVNATADFEGPLPLISLDFSNVDGKYLSEVLSTLTAPLERLDALVVVVLSTEQRAQWPNSLVNRFDHADVIKPMSIDDVRQLCQVRMATSSKIGWEMPGEALDYVFEETGGMPSKVMRLMRDMVDYERANPRDVKFDEPQIDANLDPDDDYISEDVDDYDDADDAESPVGFDLDLEELAKEPVITQEPVISMSVGGPFGALVNRNRLNKQAAPPFDKTKSSNKSFEPAGVDANQLWLANEPEAMLIQEEVDEEEEIVGEEFEDHAPQEPLYEESHSTIQEKQDVEGLFGQLLKALHVPAGMGIADLLAAIRRPVIGQKESNILDVQTLRSLSKSEATLVEVGSEREFSPSDSRLQDRLNVRRPRMSQMCNRLYRAGVLSVQQKGRTRMFRLTNDARAQLVAWGMMEASV